MPDTNRNYNAPNREPAGGEREVSQTRKKKVKRRRPLILTILIRFFQVVGTLLLIGVITGSFLICYAAVYVKTAVMPNTFLDLSAYILNENSVIYYQDKTSGRWLELQTLMGEENRVLVEYKDIPEDLINAFIAIEDKRFWEHPGVDWKRTAYGVLCMFTGRNLQGGSTIDQQLIKNVTEYDDVTVTRKILEIFKALEMEKNYKKEEILTVYLNCIYMGNKCFGVQAAARYYFGKDVWDLSLAECASLAGITNNPSLYAPQGVVEVVRYTCKDCKDYYLDEKPDVCETCGGKNFDNGVVWTNREYNKARQELILREMAKEDISPNGAYISEAERAAAAAQPLTFRWDRQQAAGDDDPDQAGTAAKASADYSWYVEAVIDDAIKALKEQGGLNTETAKRLVYCGGLSIYVPYDPEIQAAVDAIYNDRSNLDQVSSRTGQRLMSAMTVVDNSTGYVVAIGNTMEKTVDRGLNPAVHSRRPPGSSIKPLSVYSPAIEMGLITPASVVDDNPQRLNGRVWPLNVTADYRGLTTVLEAVTRSVNTIALRVVEQVTPQAAYDFMENRYGFTTLEPYYVNSQGEVKSDIDRSPMSMGGLTWGVTTKEMAAAYATFPRNGMFTTATTILEIRDANEKSIVDNRNKSEPVIEARTAYYINSMLTNVVYGAGGTGYPARIQGQTVAGKTGTTNTVYDYWFCGYTKYYTAAVWTGYPNNELINNNHNNPSVTLWRKVMEIVHEGKENQAFDVPGELTTYQICKDCGLRATSNCANDVRGESRIQSFRLLKGDGPTEDCTCHVPIRICTESPITRADGTPTGYYHKAGEFCPEESIREVCVVDYERELASPSVRVSDQNALIGFYDMLSDPYCAVHTTEPPESDPPVEPTEDPNNSDPPPVTTEPYVEPSPPPTAEPTLPPVDPTEPPPPTEGPTQEPPPTDQPYVPAADPG